MGCTCGWHAPAEHVWVGVTPMWWPPHHHTVLFKVAHFEVSSFHAVPAEESGVKGEKRGPEKCVNFTGASGWAHHRWLVGDYAGHPKCYLTPAPLLDGMVPQTFGQKLLANFLYQ